MVTIAFHAERKDLMRYRRLLLLTLTLVILMQPLACLGSEVIEDRLPAIEQEALFLRIQPLTDLAVHAALRCSDQPYQLDGVTPLDDRFTQTLFSAGFDRPDVGLGEAYLSDTSLQDAWLTANFTAPHALPASSVLPDHTPEYIGVMMMECQPDETHSQLALLGEVYSAPQRYNLLEEAQMNELAFLDMRVVMTLSKDENAIGGWKVTTLLFEDDPLAEDTDTYAPLAGRTTYYSPEHAFSIMYPSVFDADSLTVQENGISGTLPQASFFISYEDRNGNTLENLIEVLRQAHPDTLLSVDEAEELITLQSSLGTTQNLWLVQLTENGVVTVYLSWDTQTGPDLSIYSGIIMDTLLLDSGSNG